MNHPEIFITQHDIAKLQKGTKNLHDPWIHVDCKIHTKETLRNFHGDYVQVFIFTAEELAAFKNEMQKLSNDFKTLKDKISP